VGGLAALNELLYGFWVWIGSHSLLPEWRFVPCSSKGVAQLLKVWLNCLRWTSKNGQGQADEDYEFST
jgi:hypothetical protein